MDVLVTLHRETLLRALADFLPMRLVLGERTPEGGPAEADPAWVEIESVESATLIAGRGLAVTCAARVHYPLPIVPDDFTVTQVSLEVRPEIVMGPRGSILQFTLDIADIDIKYLPAFLDRAVGNKINDVLHEHARVIAWNFTETLTRIHGLPRRLERVRAFELGDVTGAIEVTDEAIVLRLRAGLTFHHATV